MTWHVLLFGAPTDGLSGVAADLRRMTTLVERSCLDGLMLSVYPAATRADFVAALGGLHTRIGPGDGVLVYYSGHGLRLRDPDSDQFAHALVPCDASEAPADAFGYVLQEELSAWFWRLTAVTHNVTWIADCCHAGAVLRGASRVRGLEVRRRRFLAIRQQLLAELPAAALDLDGNPHVVRVNACAGERRAFEDPVEGGHLTRALAESLASVDHRPIVCADLGRLVVRRLVRERQTPVFAGPVRRWWLTDHQAPPRRFPTAVLDDTGTLLAGGVLLDHHCADCYVVLDPDGTELAELTITEPAAHRSRCTSQRRTRPLPAGATAVLRTAGRPRGSVELPPDLDPRGPLCIALARSGYLALGDSEAPRVARLSIDAGLVRVLHPCGEEVGAWPNTEPPETLVAVVEGLACQAALIGLRAAAPTPPAGQYRCETQPDAVTVVGLASVPVYVSAFELRRDGRIELVTRDQPDGEAVLRGRTLVVRPPRRDPASAPRRLVIVVTDVRIDLRAWTCEAPQRPPATRGDTTPWFAVHVFDV